MPPHHNHRLDASVVWHESLPSTMSEAALLASQGAAHGSCVAALTQTQGRGRHGNTWWSPKGGGLWATFILHLPGGRQPEGFSLVAGLAVLRCAHALGAISAGLKWPNDVLVSDRKLAGVLVQAADAASHHNGQYTLLLGVGINLRPKTASSQMTAPSQVAARHIGLHELTAKEHTPNEVLDELKQHLKSCWTVWLKNGLGPLLEEIKAHHVLTGRLVRALGPGGRAIFGQVVGIGDRGELQLESPDGLIDIHAGEVCEVRPTEG